MFVFVLSQLNVIAGADPCGLVNAINGTFCPLQITKSVIASTVGVGQFCVEQLNVSEEVQLAPTAVSVKLIVCPTDKPVILYVVLPVGSDPVIGVPAPLIV